MKVLRKVCRHCGYIALFSVEILCRPGTAEEVGNKCPSCHRPLGIVSLATELDMEEIGPEPDVALITATIAKFTAG
jgi:hypothetical protein